MIIERFAAQIAKRRCLQAFVAPLRIFIFILLG